MIEYNFADKNDMAFLMQTRLTMLKEVNSLPADYIFSDEFTESTRFSLKQTISLPCLPQMTIKLSAVLPFAIQNFCLHFHTKAVKGRTL